MRLPRKLEVLTLEDRCTPAATLLGDINPGLNRLGSSPSQFTTVENTIFFTATDGLNGTELWKTDGSDSGTTLVKDISPGENSSRLQNLTAVGGNLFFTVSEGYSISLWKSDGTDAGTEKVTSFPVNFSGAEPQQFSAFNDKLFFTIGVKLYASDGTSAGTVVIADRFINSYPFLLQVAKGQFFFVADSVEYGRELWSTDGTTAGTKLFNNITPGNGSSEIRNLFVWKENLIVTIADSATGIDQLWLLDVPTRAATRITSLDGLDSLVSTATSWFSFRDQLYFFGREKNAYNAVSLWKSDGLTSGTVSLGVVNDSSYYSPRLIGQSDTQFYFTFFYNFSSGRTANYGYSQIWASEGTTSTVKLYDGNLGTNLTASIFEKSIYFQVENGDLWRSTGTRSGTTFFQKSVSYLTDPFAFARGQLFYAGTDGAHGPELWKSDGSPSGTGLFKQINSIPQGSSPSILTSAGNELLFSAVNEQGDYGLWTNLVSPTVIGAKNIANFPAVEPGSSPITDISSDGKMTYILVKDKDAIHGSTSGYNSYDSALWVTDGTSAGTSLVLKSDGSKIYGTELISVGKSVFLLGLDKLYQFRQDSLNPTIIVTNNNNIASIQNLIESNGKIYFTQAVNYVRKMFVIQDSSAVPIEVIGTTPFQTYLPLVHSSGMVYFQTYGDSRPVIWKTDGTMAGTVRVTAFDEINTSYQLQNFTDVNGTIYFTLSDVYPSEQPSALPRQLWKSDGTEAGTVLVLDSLINSVSQFSSLTNLNGTLYFLADDGTHGNELWKTNGTPSGTVLVKDINPTGTSTIGSLLSVNDVLYFTANDGVHGRELWKSDGTAAGTILEAEVQPGSSGSSPTQLVQVGNRLYFAAINQTVGEEVWFVEVPPAVISPPVTPKPSLNLVGVPQIAVGSDAGGGVVRFLNPDQTERFSLTPFEGFTGGVRTASADFNGDGIADLVVGTGPGMATRVKILNGVDQSVLFDLAPFEAAFTGGIFVAVGDINGDGKPDLLISPDEGGGPRVRIFSGIGFTQIADYFGIDDTTFRGGVRISVGDMDGDGMGEVIVAAGFGGGPRVTVWRGSVVAQGGTPSADAAIANFFAFETALRNGAYIAAGDFDGDGKADLAFGGGPGGGPRVRIFDGPGVIAANGTFSNLDELPDSQRANFFSGDVNNRGGIRLAVKDLDNDTQADLVTGSGSGGGAKVIGYAGKDLGKELFSFDAIASFNNGVYVG